MAWGTPLWSLDGHGIYVEPGGDTGWMVESGDAEHHVLESDETTIHDVGRPSARRTWRGLIRTYAIYNSLNSIVGNNVTYVSPMTGDTTGTCRVLKISAKSVGDIAELLVPKWHVTIELLRR